MHEISPLPHLPAIHIALAHGSTPVTHIFTTHTALVHANISSTTSSYHAHSTGTSFTSLLLPSTQHSHRCRTTSTNILLPSTQHSHRCRTTTGAGPPLPTSSCHPHSTATGAGITTYTNLLLYQPPSTTHRHCAAQKLSPRSVPRQRSAWPWRGCWSKARGAQTSAPSPLTSSPASPPPSHSNSSSTSTVTPPA
jgi:hypothetical protein